MPVEQKQVYSLRRLSPQLEARSKPLVDFANYHIRYGIVSITLSGFPSIGTGFSGVQFEMQHGKGSMRYVDMQDVK